MSRDVKFEGVLTAASGARAYVTLPFDPEPVWGRRGLYRIGGAANGQKFRGVVERIGDEWRLMLTPMWVRCAGLSTGDKVGVVARLEGPQRDDLDPDLAAALAAEPQAAAFWDNLAQFDRKAYGTWISGTRRRPEVRAERIAEVVRLLKAKVKARP
jgi:hypothetical protein